MVFEGTCYVTPILGAYLADSHWGRYKTILVFSSIYLCGMVCLTLTSWLPGLTPGPYDDPTWAQNALLFGSLGVIALGTGGIKPNVSAFGADQFDEKDPQVGWAGDSLQDNMPAHTQQQWTGCVRSVVPGCMLCSQLHTEAHCLLLAAAGQAREGAVF